MEDMGLNLRRYLISAFTALGLGFAWLGGVPAPVQAAQNESITLRAHIKYPPYAVSDLTAAPVGLQNGDVQLTWTAPANLNQVPMDYYFVRFATYPASGVGNATQWWTDAAGSERVLGPAHAPGVIEFGTISGLTLGVTHYFGIQAVDLDGSVSPIDTRIGMPNQAASRPLNNGGAQPPATPTNFVGFAIGTDSVMWMWDLDVNAAFYRLLDHPSNNLVGQTNSPDFTESGLTPNTVLSRTLIAVNGQGSSVPTAVRTIYTLAATPTALAANTITFNSVTLGWNANGNAASTQYRVERSLDNVTFAPIQIVTGVTFKDTPLAEETSYYYRLVAINGNGLLATPTASVVAYTPKKIDLLAPDVPLGFKGLLDVSHNIFTLIWEDVTQNDDGSPITDLAGYNIYRRTTLQGAGSKVNSAPITLKAFADQVNNQTFYYTVRAIDTAENESQESFVVDSSPQANVIFLSNDGFSSIRMPASVNDLLRSEHNKYGVPLQLALVEKPVAQNTQVVRTVRLSILRGDTKAEVNDLAFNSPQVIVAIGYNTINGQLATGRPVGPNEQQPAGAAPLGAGATPDKLSLFWNNGNTWVKVGGTVDAAAQVVKIRTSFLGDYQLRLSAAATSLSLGANNVYPRVFTPNGDGLNDTCFFVLENPNDATVTGEIFDLAGRRVAALRAPANGGGIATTLTWDGRDFNGSVVPGGAYMYKITGEGKTFTGTVGVAR